MNISYKHNVGPIDRIIRLLLTAILLILAFLAPTLLNPTWAIILGVIGLLMLVEGATGY